MQHRQIYISCSCRVDSGIFIRHYIKDFWVAAKMRNYSWKKKISDATNENIRFFIVSGNLIIIYEVFRT
jgi:hypothetical protein